MISDAEEIKLRRILDGDESEPYHSPVAITPDDNNDLDFLPRALWINDIGTVVVACIVWGNENMFRFRCEAPALLPVAARRVAQTNTTATDIIGLR